MTTSRTYIPRTEPCPYCKGTDFDYIDNGPHVEVVCISLVCENRQIRPCGHHLGFAPQKADKLAASWRRKVKENGLRKCARCGKTEAEVKIQAHHLVPRMFMPELALKEENGMCLCVDCHKLIHKVKGGIADDDYKEENQIEEE